MELGDLNAAEHALAVDVDHLLPVLDTQVIEPGNGHDASVVDERVALPVPLACHCQQCALSPRRSDDAPRR